MAEEKGKSAYFLNFVGASLKVQHYRPGAKTSIVEKTFVLPAALAGPPGLGSASLVLPLANGILERLPLGEGVGPAHGPNWRAPGVEDDARGHVVSLPGEDFLTTDGSGGLHLLHWSDPKVWEKKGSVKLARRIV